MAAVAAASQQQCRQQCSPSSAWLWKHPCRIRQFHLHWMPHLLHAWCCVLQEVEVTLHSSGGHSSMPPIDGSSIGARLGSFLSAMTASPPAPRLVSPTREFLEGLVELSGPWLALLVRVVKVGWPCFSVHAAAETLDLSSAAVQEHVCCCGQDMPAKNCVDVTAVQSAINQSYV